jgi:hypothetical protein
VLAPSLPILGAALLALPPQPTPPAGLTWTGRTPGSSFTTLYRADADGTIRTSRVPYRLNALGCARGTLYALAAEHRGKRFSDGPHVVRLSGNRVTDLGAVKGGTDPYPVADAYAATAIPGPGKAVTLIVAAGQTLRRVRVEPGPPTVTSSRPLPRVPYLGDWDVTPSGTLVSVASRRGTAVSVTIKPGASQASITAIPSLGAASSGGGLFGGGVPGGGSSGGGLPGGGLPGGGGSAFGGVARTPDGSLWALNNKSGALWRIPARGRVAVRSLGTGRLEGSDAAYCDTPARTPAPPVRQPSATPAPPPVVAASPLRRTPVTPVPVPSLTPPSTPPATSSPPPPPSASPAASFARNPRTVAELSAAPPRRRLRPDKHAIPIIGGGAGAALLIALRLRRRRHPPP